MTICNKFESPNACVHKSLVLVNMDSMYYTFLYFALAFGNNKKNVVKCIIWHWGPLQYDPKIKCVGGFPFKVAEPESRIRKKKIVLSIITKYHFYLLF